MKKKVVVILIITFIFFPPSSFSKEIHEEEGKNTYKDTDLITFTDDLSIPKLAISSIDVNEHGEILICYGNKMIVFNSDYIPIKAFDVKTGRGSYPTAVWNQKTERIVYIRGGGYEINNDGKILTLYEEINSNDYRPTYAESDSVTYKLENRVPLPNFTNTYSTLISIDSDGNEKVLHNAIWSQVMEQFVAIGIVVGCTIILTYLVVQEYKKSKIKRAKPHKRAYVNARPRIILKK